MRRCIYCDEDRDEALFSDEHIWPQALGGDHLGDFWRTTDVCRRCNSIAGVFADGGFIKSWLGSAERSHGADNYMPLDAPERAALPFQFLGSVVDDELSPDQVCEYWVGRCGMNVFHFRPANDETWDSYAGGDPRRSGKGKIGRAYLVISSPVEFWIKASIASFRASFAYAEKILANAAAYAGEPGFETYDPGNPSQVLEGRIVSRLMAGSPAKIHARSNVVLDEGYRFLAKLGLALGFKIFGARFGATEDAWRLRAMFREAQFEKRQAIELRLSIIINRTTLQGLEKQLHWDGGWVLLLRIDGAELCLFIVTPTGKVMAVQITDDPDLIAGLHPSLWQGLVWVTIPALGEGMGPFLLTNYLAHKDGSKPSPTLTALAAKRHDEALLPDCGLRDRPEPPATGRDF